LGKDGGTPSDSRSQPDLKASEPHIDCESEGPSQPQNGRVPTVRTLVRRGPAGSSFRVLGDHELRCRAV